jgi:hypothetical protein
MMHSIDVLSPVATALSGRYRFARQKSYPLTTLCQQATTPELLVRKLPRGEVHWPWWPLSMPLLESHAAENFSNSQNANILKWSA